MDCLVDAVSHAVGEFPVEALANVSLEQGSDGVCVGEVCVAPCTRVKTRICSWCLRTRRCHLSGWSRAQSSDMVGWNDGCMHPPGQCRPISPSRRSTGCSYLVKRSSRYLFSEPPGNRDHLEQEVGDTEVVYGLLTKSQTV